MELLSSFIDIVLHLDAHLLVLVQQYGMWIYAILFAIIFSETGLVVAPFLPGDSLLFVIGALCGMGSLQLQVALPLLMLAAFMGDNTNYWVGRLLGLRLLNHPNQRWIKHEHLEKTHAFYAKHGGKTVIFARFLPIIRTFAPFVAGIGTMNYRLYLMFSILGGSCLDRQPHAGGLLLRQHSRHQEQPDPDDRRHHLHLIHTGDPRIHQASQAAGAISQDAGSVLIPRIFVASQFAVAHSSNTFTSQPSNSAGGCCCKKSSTRSNVLTGCVSSTGAASVCLLNFSPDSFTATGKCKYCGIRRPSKRCRYIWRGVESSKSAPRTICVMPWNASSTTTAN